MQAPLALGLTGLIFGFLVVFDGGVSSRSRRW
jgi:hypothetical protein